MIDWVVLEILWNFRTNKQTNEKAIGDCVLAKICLYNAHCYSDGDNCNIVDYIDVWLGWKSIGLHILAFCQVSWICVHLLYPSDLTSRCDVISDVINIKSTFFGKFHTVFPYLIWKWTYLKYFEIFKMAAILMSGELLNRKLYRKLSPTSR